MSNWNQRKRAFNGEGLGWGGYHFWFCSFRAWSKIDLRLISQSQKRFLKAKPRNNHEKKKLDVKEHNRLKESTKPAYDTVQNKKKEWREKKKRLNKKNRKTLNPFPSRFSPSTKRRRDPIKFNKKKQFETLFFPSLSLLDGLPTPVGSVGYMGGGGAPPKKI